MNWLVTADWKFWLVKTWIVDFHTGGTANVAWMIFYRETSTGFLLAHPLVRITMHPPMCARPCAHLPSALACLPARPPVRPPACLPACLRPPVRLPACLPACPPARLPACPPARLPACLPACPPAEWPTDMYYQTWHTFVYSLQVAD